MLTEAEHGDRGEGDDDELWGMQREAGLATEDVAMMHERSREVPGREASAVPGK